MPNLVETREIPDLDALDAFCRELLFDQHVRKLAIYGDLGAGKTTLVKQMGRHLGITQPMTSPTFALLNEYESPKGPVYHFDLYRLSDEEELMNLGFEEYLENTDAYVFIEWPELVEGMLSKNFWHLYIHVTGPDSRSIHCYR